MKKLDTAGQVLQWANSTAYTDFKQNDSDGDVSRIGEWGFSSEEHRTAICLAECVRLRQAFDALQDDTHRMWDGGHSVNDLYDHLRNAMKGEQ